jgi:flagellar M-ring protein FliF
MSPRTRALAVLGAAGLVAVLTAAWLWTSSPPFGVLFTNVADRDGGAILAQLSQMNIPYRNAEGGTILVPVDKVHEARLKLASQGLPKGSIVGFEIMESQKFGQTQFQEQLNYQRGLEGELARSIQTLAPVAAARVHLAIPKASGFLREKEPPTASVLVQLHPGQGLDRAQIAGVVHLVASSVPELAPKNVSVVDQHGVLLASSKDNAAGLDSTQLDYLAQVESATIKRIEDILEPIVGPGNVRAQVTADVDFSAVEIQDESYKPNPGAEKASIRSQSSTESSQPGGPGAQGVPGALSNQPPVPVTAPISGQAPPLNPPAGTASGSNHREMTTNYELDRNVRHTRSGAGQIRRLTAAVVVNNKAGAEAHSPSVPWDAKELENIQALARQAMGFSETRGDALNLVNAPFTQPELVAAEPVPFLQRPEVLGLAKEGGKALLLLLLTAIVVFGVLRPALQAIAESKVPEQSVTPGPAAAEAPAPPALIPPASVIPVSLEGVRQIARSDPAAVANVVKAWVGDAKA